MSYIILNKNKIEERIKEYENEQFVDLYDEFRSLAKLGLLKHLLKESIDAETVFNAARENKPKILSKYTINTNFQLRYNSFLDYTKTLNI